jgi:hypothetical protein
MIEQERGDGQKCRHTRNKRAAPTNSHDFKHLRRKKRSPSTAKASGNDVDSNRGGGVVRVGVTYVAAAGHMDQHQACRQNRSTCSGHDPMDRANAMLAPVPPCLHKSTLTGTAHSSSARAWKWGILPRRS